MAKKVGEKIIVIFSILFIIGTGILIWMMNKDMKGKFVGKFVVIYLYVLFLLIIAIICTTLFRLKNLKWADIKKIIYKGLYSFFIYGILFCILDYFFKGNKLDLYKNFSRGIPIVLGICAFEIILFKKKRELQ